MRKNIVLLLTLASLNLLSQQKIDTNLYNLKWNDKDIKISQERIDSLMNLSLNALNSYLNSNKFNAMFDSLSYKMDKVFDILIEDKKQLNDIKKDMKKSMKEFKPQIDSVFRNFKSELQQLKDDKQKSKK